VSRDLPRRIGLLGALAIMVGIIIGSGIFRTPTSIARQLDSPGLILVLWVVGGGLSLCGALAYAELGAMFPHSGGIYVFLREGFGPLPAFVFGWMHLLIAKPLAIAAIATVFSEHLNRMLNVTWDPRVSTCVTIMALTALNARGVRIGSGVAVVLTGLKVLALAAVVALALALSGGNAANFAPAPASGKPLLAALAPVMVAILWTYDGWNDVAFVAGEIREPQRLLPRAMVGGTLLVTGLYVAVNAVYAWMLPLEQVRTVKTVAPLVMDRLLGRYGGDAVTVVVMISTLGATHGSVLTGARASFAQACDRLLFHWLSGVHPRHATPHVALWTQGCLACVAVTFLGTFERLTSGFVFTMWIFYGLAVAGLLVLRVRRPSLERPVRCPGYPVTPVVFLLAAATMTGLSIWGSPRETLPWMGVMVAGVPVYYVWKSAVKAAAETEEPGDESRR